MALPYYGYLVPLLIAAGLVTVATLVGLVVMFVRIKRWNRNGELQERLQSE